MPTPFIAELKLVSFNFAPKGWAQANGQLLPINQNQALFSLLGTTYGGNGQTTFALPNLQGRVPIHQGGDFVIGQVGGAESVTINASTMGAHTHPLQATTAQGLTEKPFNHLLGQSGSASGDAGYVAVGNLTALNPASIQPFAGGGQPHTNIQPYLVLTTCIALQGIFPSQN